MFIVSGLYTTEEEPRILWYPWPFGLHIINYFPGCWRERAASWFIFKRIVTPQNDHTVVGKLVCETVHHTEVCPKQPHSTVRFYHYLFLINIALLSRGTKYLFYICFKNLAYF